MNEIYKEWLKRMYDREIMEAEGTVHNEFLWELGYDGEMPNPHTENISMLNEYLKILKEMKEELEDD